MLRNIEHLIPDEDPYFRGPGEIALARDFQEKHGDEFSQCIAKVVNLLVETRPHDPIMPFVST